MSTDKEAKVTDNIKSLAQSLVDNLPACSGLHTLGQGILLLIDLSSDPASRDKAVKLLAELKAGGPAGSDLEKLLQDLGIRLN
jgi:hypothetical protein